MKSPGKAKVSHAMSTCRGETTAVRCAAITGAPLPTQHIWFLGAIAWVVLYVGRGGPAMKHDGGPVRIGLVHLTLCVPKLCVCRIKTGPGRGTSSAGTL